MTDKNNKQKTAIDKKPEDTSKFKLVTALIKTSLCFEFAIVILIGVAAFNPNADKAFIKDVIPGAIISQNKLLEVALRHYFKEKK